MIGHLCFFLCELSTLLILLVVPTLGILYMLGNIPRQVTSWQSLSPFLWAASSLCQLFSVWTTSEMHFLTELCQSSEYYVEKARFLVMTMAMYLPMSDPKTVHQFIIRMISKHFQNQRDCILSFIYRTCTYNLHICYLEH